MLKVQIKLPLSYNNETVKTAIAKSLKIDVSKVKSYKLLKLSVDARDKSNVIFNACVAVNVDANKSRILHKFKNVSEYKPTVYAFKKAIKQPNHRPVIVGAGPAGLFCAFTLAKAGLMPIIIERGDKIEDRVKCVELFWENGVLNCESNVQFGEGGAGTFSDGKLNTGVNDSRIPLVLETFVECGAPEEILWRQKPHIGTDKLRQVIVNLRKNIEALGGEFHFNCKMESVIAKGGNVTAVKVNECGVNHDIPCGILVLALGHSARDTFYNLYNFGVEMIHNPFAVGVRIEHSQDFINRSQYGDFASHPALPTADYKLAVHLQNGRGVYTFCMCPGGFVVNASSEREMIAVNGMSNFDRAGNNANSAVLVGVNTADFESGHALAGIEFQRKIERAAYLKSGGYNPPAQTLGAFSGGNTKIEKIIPTCKVNECDLKSVLPDFVSESITIGINSMNKKIKGFADENAVLTAPETRSSSPVRILRNDCGQSNIAGLYPCGEGAGYAGGITSAATDGIKTAEKIIENLKG